MGLIFIFIKSWSSQDSFWLGLLGCFSFGWLGLRFDPAKDWFNACGVGRRSAALSGHPFISFEGELFPFPILLGLHKIKFSVWMYFQSIYIAIIVRIINEKL